MVKDEREKRTKRVSVSFTPSEYNEVREHAESNGLCVNTAIRVAALKVARAGEDS